MRQLRAIAIIYVVIVLVVMPWAWVFGVSVPGGPDAAGSVWVFHLLAGYGLLLWAVNDE